MDKEEAQRRADRIREFREEMDLLVEEQVLVLTEEQRRRVDEYHADLLSSLARVYDVDTSAAQKQMTVGMRIISLLGSMAISAAVFFFFYRIWGLLSTGVQVGILISGPVLATIGVGVAARKERTLYFSTIIALVALACFVLNLTMLGQIFNITPTQNAFLVWALFSLILAYTYNIRLLLVAGIISLTGYLSATAGTFSGCYWLSFGERPENFIFAGLILFGISFVPHQGFHEFPSIYRFSGMLTVFIAILILSNWGRASYLMLPGNLIEYAYQAASFLVSGFTIWLGVRAHWGGMTNLGATFFMIYLYTKFFDWWWEWMPKYLFFLILGLVAVLFLTILRRLRGLNREVLA
jgi:uncharacterized membrane protein